MNRLAIDIGGTKFALALFSGGRIVQRMVHPVDRAGGRQRLLADLEPLLRRWRTSGAIAACGVGFGGPVDFQAQRVALSTHAPGWEGFPLRDYVQDLLGASAIIDNDANCAALGEALYGAGRGARPLFYMTISTGIGGGLVLENDQLYRGADSWAGEIGHLTIRPGGPECLCGARGCLERLCSGLWLERDYGRRPRELFEDPAFAARYAGDLALGVKAAIMLLNPARVVIGGGLAQAGERLFAPLRAELSRNITAWSGARLEVRAAELGGDSVLWGAFALACAAAG